MHIVVASSSVRRQSTYREAIEGLGHRILPASGGVDCLEHFQRNSAGLLILEAPLLWGGSDGVLDVVQNQWNRDLPVILVAVGSGSIDWFKLSRFRVDDFLFRVPTAQELEKAIHSVVGRQSRRLQLDHANKPSGEAKRKPSLPRNSAAVSLTSDPPNAWTSAGSLLPPTVPGK
jgi:DNA-binding response OmpR family regulator